MGRKNKKPKSAATTTTAKGGTPGESSEANLGEQKGKSEVKDTGAGEIGQDMNAERKIENKAAENATETEKTKVTENATEAKKTTGTDNVIETDKTKNEKTKATEKAKETEKTKATENATEAKKTTGTENVIETEKTKTEKTKATEKVKAAGNARETEKTKAAKHAKVPEKTKATEDVKETENAKENSDEVSRSTPTDVTKEEKTNENPDTKEGTLESPRDEGKKKKNKKKKDAPVTFEKLKATVFKDCHGIVADLLDGMGLDEDAKKFLVKGTVTESIIMLSNFCLNLEKEVESAKTATEPVADEKTKGRRRLRDRDQELQSQVRDLEAQNENLSMKLKVAEAKNKRLAEQGHTCMNEADRQAIQKLEAQNNELSMRLQQADMKVTSEVDTNRKLNCRMTQLEEENAKYLMNQTKVSELIQKLRENVDQKNSELTHLREEIACQTEVTQKCQFQIVNLTEKNRGLTLELTEMTADRDAFKERFSQLAGAKLTSGNADITDLSDENRPQKLAEKFSELYDNQWTDAYEELMDNHSMSEEDTIKALLEVLKECVTFCGMKAEEQEMCLTQNVLDDFTLSRDNIPTETLCNGEDTEAATESKAMHKGLALQDTKTLKDMRKANGARTLPVLQKLMRKEMEDRGDHVEGPLFKDYLEKCVEICWYSCIQDPPIEYDFDFPHGAEFDSDLMKTYTKKGTTVDYVVWPLLRLHINGPILAKGVVQPIDEKKSEKSAA